MGNGDERGLAVSNRAIPVMSNSRLARINESLTPYLLAVEEMLSFGVEVEMRMCDLVVWLKRDSTHSPR